MRRQWADPREITLPDVGPQRAVLPTQTSDRVVFQHVLQGISSWRNMLETSRVRFAVAPNGRKVVVMSQHNGVVLDMATGAVRDSFAVKLSRDFKLVMSPNGSFFAAGSGSFGEPSVLLIFRLADPTQPVCRQLIPGMDWNGQICWSAADNKIYVLTSNLTVLQFRHVSESKPSLDVISSKALNEVFNFTSGFSYWGNDSKGKEFFIVEKDYRQLSWDGKLMAALHGALYLSIFDTATGKLLQSVRIQSPRSTNITNLKFGPPDSHMVAFAYRLDELVVVNWKTGDILRQVLEEDQDHELVWSPLGDIIAVSNSLFQIVGANAGKLLRVRGAFEYSVAFSADGSELITNSLRGNIIRYRRKIALPGIHVPVPGLEDVNIATSPPKEGEIENTAKDVLSSDNSALVTSSPSLARTSSEISSPATSASSAQSASEASARSTSKASARSTSKESAQSTSQEISAQSSSEKTSASDGTADNDDDSTLRKAADATSAGIDGKRSDTSSDQSDRSQSPPCLQLPLPSVLTARDIHDLEAMFDKLVTLVMRADLSIPSSFQSFLEQMQQLPNDPSNHLATLITTLSHAIWELEELPRTNASKVKLKSIDNLLARVRRLRFHVEKALAEQSEVTSDSEGDQSQTALRQSPARQIPPHGSSNINDTLALSAGALDSFVESKVQTAGWHRNAVRNWLIHLALVAEGFAKTLSGFDMFLKELSATTGANMAVLHSFLNYLTRNSIDINGESISKNVEQDADVSKQQRQDISFADDDDDDDMGHRIEIARKKFATRTAQQRPEPASSLAGGGASNIKDYDNSLHVWSGGVFFGTCSSVAVSRGGDKFVSWSGSLLRMWDLHTKESIGLLPTAGLIGDAVFSPDASMIATTNPISNEVSFLSTNDGALLLKRSFAKKLRDIIKWSPNDLIAIATHGNGVFLFHAFDCPGNDAAKNETHGSAPSPLPTASTAVHCLLLSSCDTCDALEFSPDGQLLACAGNNRAIYIVATDSKSVTQRLFGHSDVISCVSFSPDGKKLASGGFSEPALVWSVATGSLICVLDLYGPLRCHFSWSRDGRYLVGTTQKELKLFVAIDMEDSSIVEAGGPAETHDPFASHPFHGLDRKESLGPAKINDVVKDAYDPNTPSGTHSAQDAAVAAAAHRLAGICLKSIDIEAIQVFFVGDGYDVFCSFFNGRFELYTLQLPVAAADSERSLMLLPLISESEQLHTLVSKAEANLMTLEKVLQNPQLSPLFEFAKALDLTRAIYSSCLVNENTTDAESTTHARLSSSSDARIVGGMEGDGGAICSFDASSLQQSWTQLADQRERLAKLIGLLEHDGNTLVDALICFAEKVDEIICDKDEAEYQHVISILSERIRASRGKMQGEVSSLVARLERMISASSRPAGPSSSSSGAQAPTPEAPVFRIAEKSTRRSPASAGGGRLSKNSSPNSREPSAFSFSSLSSTSSSSSSSSSLPFNPFRFGTSVNGAPQSTPPATPPSKAFTGAPNTDAPTPSPSFSFGTKATGNQSDLACSASLLSSPSPSPSPDSFNLFGATSTGLPAQGAPAPSALFQSATTPFKFGASATGSHTADTQVPSASSQSATSPFKFGVSAAGSQTQGASPSTFKFG